MRSRTPIGGYVRVRFVLEVEREWVEGRIPPAAHQELRERELPVPNSLAAWLSLAWNSGRKIDEAPRRGVNPASVRLHPARHLHTS